MGKETVLFKSEEKKTLGEVTGFLRKLADRLDSNKVEFIQGNQSVKVKVPSTVELEIKVEKETGKRKTKKKIEIEIEWIVGGDTGKGASGVELG
ncbi:MAG: hypothetical protein Kow0089_06900 [Desulfobulbaceae bacterium]